jgi:hypothetical protein
LEKAIYSAIVQNESLAFIENGVVKMRRNVPLFIGGIVFLALFNLTIAGVLVSLVFNLFSLSLAPAQQFLSELVTLFF